MTIEDETDISNIIVWPKTFEKYRRTVMSSRFVAIRGRVQRVGIVVHVIAESLIDLAVVLPRIHEADKVHRPVQLEFSQFKSRDFH